MSLDTIQLKIPKNDILIERMSFFKHQYSSITLEREDQKKIRTTNNDFRQQQKAKMLYVPKFWLERTTWNAEPDNLVLELSVPKFLFGTSLYGVTEEHLPQFIAKMHTFCNSELRVRVGTQAIENAIVTQLAYAKNIRLDTLCTTQQALQIFIPFDYRPSSKYTKTWYATDGGGTGIKHYNTLTSLAIYEKLPEIAAHAVTKIEHDISRQWKKKRLVSVEHIDGASQVLRFEHTLQKRHAVNQNLRKMVRGKEKDFPLYSVFPNSVGDGLLKAQVDTLLNHKVKDFAFLPSLENPQLQQILKCQIPRRSSRNELLAVMHGIQTIGIKAYREDFLADYSDRTWRRRMMEIEQVSKYIDWEKLPENTDRDVLHHILREFDIEPKYAQPEQQQLMLQ